MIWVDDYPMTVEKALSALSEAPQGAVMVVPGFGYMSADFHSYRGYYEDLAFGTGEVPITVKDFREVLRRTVDASCVGSHGGEYVTTPTTWIWVAEESELSGKLKGFELVDENTDGVLIEEGLW